MRAAIGAVLLSLAVPAAGPIHATSDSPLSDQQRPRIIRIGYTTFEGPETVRVNSTLQSISRCLKQIAKLSRPHPQPLEFEVVLGNYYQIWSWFRAGKIDAAVVSAWPAFLLERDAQAMSLLEFSEFSIDNEGYAGHIPLVTASGEFKDNPVAGLDAYLGALLSVSLVARPSERPGDDILAPLKKFQMNLVAHLSGSGFIMPSLYARSWLAGQRTNGRFLNDVERGRFWDWFYERARLMLHHGDLKADKERVDLYFSYSGRYGNAEKRDNDVRRSGFGLWKPYAPAALKSAEPVPIIPNDVLVVRRDIADQAFGVADTDRSWLNTALASGGLQDAFNDSLGGYQRVRWFNTPIHNAFRREASQLFGRSADTTELVRLYERWFQRGLFDFTIEETVNFIRQDQQNSADARLALVLSGGGVKSLYQTVLLDHLYTRRDDGLSLRNFDESPGGGRSATPQHSNGPITVHDIIGTSGGAMLAFFAAQMPQLPALTPTMKALAEGELFPPYDLPRVLSAFVFLLILCLVLAVARVFDWWGYRSATPPPLHVRSSKLMLVVYTIALVLGAVAVATTRPEAAETVPGLAGIIFAMTVLLTHFGMTCVITGVQREPTPYDRPLGTLAVLAIAIGLTTVVASGVFTYVLDSIANAQHQSGLPALSIVASAGVLVSVAGLLSAAAAGRFSLAVQREGVRDYAAGLLIIVLTIGSALLIVQILSRLRVSSALELTPGFWWLWIGCAVAIPLALLYAVARLKVPWRTELTRGITALMRDRGGAITTTMGWSMAGLWAFAFLCWGVLVAPALYGNGHAISALKAAQGGIESTGFRSNLVVTGTLLDDKDCGGTLGTERAGGLYFCFDGTEGCRTPREGTWKVYRRPIPERAFNAVFASGSPFPVFPPHSTHLPDGCEVGLVDGGFAHNVPLEAASLAGARQVLILDASPDPDDLLLVQSTGVTRSFRIKAGQLARYGPRLFDFLFSRAQELDRSVGEELVVASLRPRPPDGLWPFLLDFREDARKLVTEAAAADISQHRRIGHVLSWGRPTIFEHISGTEAPTIIGWLPEVDAQLKKLVESGKAGNVAALDLDNTCLRGDIGDAMLLKMIVELRYRGDLDAFWSLIPDASARRELRRYWTRFSAKEERFRNRQHDRPVDWGSDFTDYVVLFWRQYQRMVDEPDGARTAYPWVVRLLYGLTEKEATTIAQELWIQEADRLIGDVTVSSRYGPQTFGGGVRTRPDMVELIKRLHDGKWQVWIVTASNVFAGRAAAERLGIPPDRVIGMNLTRLPDGRLSSELVRPITYREGKREALKARGLHPAFAAGDSMTDFEMLHYASHALLIDRGKIEKKVIDPTWLRQPMEAMRISR